MRLADDEQLPGTAAHQRLLRAVVTHYRGDARVRAVALFGSLARGDWDSYSDLDLDVIVTDHTAIDIADELARLGTALAASGEAVALLVPTGPDEGDIVLRSLHSLSLRYHPLAATSPNIITQLRVLIGQLEPAEIVAAGQANAPPGRPVPEWLLDRCVQYAVEASTALRRGRYWLAVELLHRARSLLLDLYGQARGARRPLQAFQAEAEPALPARLGSTLGAFEPAALRRAHAALLDVLEADLERLAAGRVMLTADHRALLASARARVAGEQAAGAETTGTQVAPPAG